MEVVRAPELPYMGVRAWHESCSRKYLSLQCDLIKNQPTSLTQLLLFSFFCQPSLDSLVLVLGVQSCFSSWFGTSSASLLPYLACLLHNYSYAIITFFVYTRRLVMPVGITPVALGGIISAVITLIRQPPQTQKTRRLLAVLSLYLYALEALIMSFDEPASQYGHYGGWGPYGIQKSNALSIMWIHESDRWFCQFFRSVHLYAHSAFFCSWFFSCSCDSFLQLERLIRNHHVFQSTGWKPQRAPWHQLAIFLHHFGQGPDSNHISTARECGVGAGSVYLYVNRVIIALKSLGPRYIQWPTGEHLEEMKGAYHDLGFPNCIGSIDGSLIHLANTPEENPIVYYTRKGFYGVSWLSCLNTVCDKQDNMHLD